MIAEVDVPVPMRDGTRLSVDIYRPVTGGPVPALLAICAYGKGIQALSIPPQPPESPLYDGAIEAGSPEFFVERGYAHIIADSRGTGKSEGEYRGWMSRQEAEDGFDLVEWIARQPWCDGNIGMVGISYLGTIQLQVAAEQPPHLRAIMPWNAPADFYREATHHGGVVQTFFLNLYANVIGGCRFPPVTAGELSREEFDRRRRQLMADPDIAMYSQIYKLLDDPERNPGFFDILMHPFDGPFYRERSANARFDRIRIPVYFGSGWWAYGHMHLVGAFEGYTGIAAPTKLEVGPPSVLDRPLPREFNQEVVRWYDHWLKGVENGIMDEPPIRLFVTGDDRWSCASQWPLAQTDWRRLHLCRWGRLAGEPEATAGHPDVFVQQSPAQTRTISRLAFDSAPLPEELTVIGPVSLVLYAAIDADDTNWIVVLQDVDPHGGVRELTKGCLKASHRQVDPQRSLPGRPFHPHAAADPVVPGDVHEYAIALAPLAHAFHRGHRVRLEISCLDYVGYPPVSVHIRQSHMPFHLCASQTVAHWIHHDEQYPSHLLLPVIPRQASSDAVSR